jgi:hypothetical protein
MRWTPNILATLAVAVGVIALALWFGGRGHNKAAATAPQAILQTSSRKTSAPATNFSALLARRVHASRTNQANRPAPAAAPVADTNRITNWEAALDEVLRAEAEPALSAQHLLELLPRFPEDGQVEAAQHIANLLPDDNYAALGGLLTNQNTQVAVQDVVMADLLSRPNAVKLPWLLEMMRHPSLTKATDARELFQLYLDEDLGDDWAAWQQKLGQWLKDHPD